MHRYFYAQIKMMILITSPKTGQLAMLELVWNKHTSAVRLVILYRSAISVGTAVSLTATYIMFGFHL